MMVLILILLLFIILLFRLLLSRFFKSIKIEKFNNYILVNEPKNNFYYRFIDYVLNNRHPRDNSLVIKDQYGYPNRYDPRVINPMFVFDEYLSNYPNSQKII